MKVFDEEQAYREYRDYCSYNTNPLSFSIWLKCKKQKEAYEERQENIRKHPPDEDSWN